MPTRMAMISWCTKVPFLMFARDLFAVRWCIVLGCCHTDLVLRSCQPASVGDGPNTVSKSTVSNTDRTQWVFPWGPIYQRKFLWVRRGCQVSQRNGWPLGKSGELPRKSGELPGKSGKLPGNPWIAVKFHSERNFRGVAEKLRGSLGNLRGSPGTFQKLGVAWLPPSDSPNLSPRFPTPTELSEFFTEVGVIPCGGKTHKQKSPEKSETISWKLLLMCFLFVDFAP